MDPQGKEDEKGGPSLPTYSSIIPTSQPLEFSFYHIDMPEPSSGADQEKTRQQVLRLAELQTESIELLKEICGAGVKKEQLIIQQPDAPKTPGGAPGFIEHENHLPVAWDIAWDDRNLRRRISTVLEDLDRNPEPSATGYISDNILHDFARFTFDRTPDADGNLIPSYKGLNTGEWDNKEAFHVRDFDKTGIIAVSRARDGIERAAQAKAGIDFLEHLRLPRSTSGARGREIDIQAITPSALAIVFMSDGMVTPEGAGVYDALSINRHLSVNTKDKFFSHDCYDWRGPTDIPYSWTRTWWSFTMSFYVVHTGCPAKDSGPLVDAGIFSSGLTASGENKYIREEKFTVSFTSHRTWTKGDTVAWGAPRFKNISEHGSWQLIAINAPRPRYLSRENKPIEFVYHEWLDICLSHICGNWSDVLSELDRQISVPSTVMFDAEVRNQILFEDENFSNSKRYFWALQSLRVFSENIEKTIQLLPRMFQHVHLLGEEHPEDWRDKNLAANIVEFVKLRERIERKRQEIQGLSDGLFSASSVVEARLAANQSNNVRLLTLVTIAFLPISFVTVCVPILYLLDSATFSDLVQSIFSMSVLPSSATLGSFFAAVIIMSFVTFFIVFNLRISGRVMDGTYSKWTASMQKSMMEGPSDLWKSRGYQLQQGEEFQRKERPSSNWWYVSYFFRRIWSPKKSATREGANPTAGSVGSKV